MFKTLLHDWRTYQSEWYLPWIEDWKDPNSNHMGPNIRVIIFLSSSYLKNIYIYIYTHILIIE